MSSQMGASSVSRYLGTRCSIGFCPEQALTEGRGYWHYHYCFITHLLIVANEDFTAPLALAVSNARALWRGWKAHLKVPSRPTCLPGWCIWALHMSLGSTAMWW